VSTALPAGAPAHSLRGVLRIPAFRRLWIALSLSSLGDWLGLLAITELAGNLAAGSSGGFAAVNFAVGGVFIVRLLPAVLIGPVAGAFADRVDRRRTMVVADLVRFALFISIPLVRELWWLFVATLLIEVAAQFWSPAKEATVPNLVPRDRLEQANQLTLVTTYGSAPIAAALFSGLALTSSVLGVGFDFFRDNQVDLALYANGLTFLVAALTVWRLTEIPPGPAIARSADHPTGSRPPSIWRAIASGWAFIGSTPVVRGLVVGMLGAFAAGGAVIGLARSYVRDLGGGVPGYGLLFGTVFVGLAGGMFFGPRLLAGLSRRRLFALAITAAGVLLCLLSLVPDMVLATLVTLGLGTVTGVAWVTGYTLLGLEVDDALRGRTFAFVQSMVRVVLVSVLAAAPLLAALFGQPLSVQVTDAVRVDYSGVSITFLIAGLLAALLGVTSFRQMDDRPGVPLWRDLYAAWRGQPAIPTEPTAAGVFVAFEGGDGAGKSTQVQLVGQWLQGLGHEVVLTREPGSTTLGRRLREVLLDPQGEISPRAEALLYAADRAHHVNTVVRPALAAGAVVVTDRYVDSSVAYQGAGRALPAEDVVRLSAWATDGLTPDLTIVLDLPPTVALRRSAGPADRLEAEPVDFHDRVRREFLRLAAAAPARYLVVDATLGADQVAAVVRQRLAELLPERPAETSVAEPSMAEPSEAPDLPQARG
jgi:dTMP kinase